MSAKYQILPPTAPVAALQDLLEAVVRSGAQQLLQVALEAEVEDLLGRARYQRCRSSGAIARATCPGARSGWG